MAKTKGSSKRTSFEAKVAKLRREREYVAQKLPSCGGSANMLPENFGS